MATSKEIEIILQAKLEQGNAVDNAKSLGEGIASTLEHAFDGLGERIAAKMMMEMQNTLSNIKLSDMFDSTKTITQQPTYQAPYSLVDYPREQNQWQLAPLGAPGTNQPGAVPGVSPGSPPTPSTIPGNMADAQSAATEADARRTTAQQEAGLQNEAPIRTPVGTPSTETRREVPTTDTQVPREAPHTPAEQGSDPQVPKSHKPKKEDDDHIPYNRPRYGLGHSSSFMGIEGPLTATFNEAKDKADREMRMQQDSIVTKFRAFDTVRKMDPTIKMDDEFKEQVQSAKKYSISQASQGASEISDLAKAIKDLQGDIEDNSDAVREATKKEPSQRTENDAKIILDQEQRKVATNSKIEEVNRIQSHLRDTDNFVKKVDAYDSEEQMAARRKAIGVGTGIAAVGGMIGEGFQFAGRMDMLRQTNAAGNAQLNNSNVRDYLNSDVDNMMATEALGGDESLTNRARTNTRLGIIGKGVAGALEFAGGAVGAGLSFGAGAVTAPTGIGAVMGAAGGMTSLGIAADGGRRIMGAYEDFMTFDSKAAQEKSNLKGTEIERQKEWLTMGKTAMGQSINTYNQAQSLGAAEVSEDLYGVRAPRKMTVPNPNGGPAFHFEDTTGSGKDSMLAKGVDAGLNTGQVNQFLGSTMASMGGYFPTQQLPMGSEMLANKLDGNNRMPMRSDGVQKQLVEGMKLKAGGFSNFDQIAGTLFNQQTNNNPLGGAADRERSLKETGDMYREALEAGMDKLKIPHYLEQMASRMAATGPGSQYAEEGLARRGLATAQGIYGDKLEGKQVQNIQGLMNNLTDRASGDDTMSVVSGVNRVHDMNKKFGTKLDSRDEVFMRRFKQDPKAFREWYNTDKKEKDQISEEKAKEIVDYNEEHKISSQNDAFGFQDAKGRRLNMAMRAGAQTAQQVVDTGKIIDGQKTAPTRKAVQGEDKAPLGQDQQKAFETAKVEMLTTGLSGMNEIVERVNKQLGAFHDKLQEFTNLRGSILNDAATHYTPENSPGTGVVKDPFTGNKHTYHQNPPPPPPKPVGQAPQMPGGSQPHPFDSTPAHPAAAPRQ